MDYLTACFRCAFILFPTIITEPGKYKTRCGEIVEITTKRDKFIEWGGVYSNGIRDSWHKSGRIYSGMISDNDIVGVAK